VLRKFVLDISNLDVQTGALVDSLVYDARQRRVTGMPCIHSAAMQSATVTQHRWVCVHPAAQVLAQAVSMLLSKCASLEAIMTWSSYATVAALTGSAKFIGMRDHQTPRQPDTHSDHGDMLHVSLHPFVYKDEHHAMTCRFAP